MVGAPERLCVALDFADRERAIAMAERLAGSAGWFKVGLELFTAEGPSLLAEVGRRGRLFLDLKFHDIPNTVAGAVACAVRHGAALLNVHALGGRPMIARAVEAAGEAASRAGLARPKVVAVTLLTSLDEAVLEGLPLEGTAGEIVLRLAELARRAGADGVVCPPSEVAAVKRACGMEFFTVAPGIRPARENVASAIHGADDQRRVSTPAAAIGAGADLLVVGRPITAQKDPGAAAEFILSEIERAMHGGTS